MALTTGTLSTYAAIGNREDLSDMIYDVSPTETPFLSAIKKKKGTATNHEWQTDVLAAAAVNAQLEGNDFTASAPAATVRLSNYMQILAKQAVVSRTQEVVNKAGRKSEMAYQIARRLKEIKRDAEYAMLDGGAAVGVAKVAGNTTTARKMGTLNTYVISAVSVGATGAAAAGNGAGTMTAGTNRALTSTLLDGVLTTQYTNGGDPSLLFVSPTNKTVVGDFTAGGATRFVDTNDKKLTTSIDVYVGDFATLKVVPCRQLNPENVYSIDTEYVAVSELDGVKTEDIAKVGDGERKQITWEITLEVCNEKAQGLVADTNG